MKGIRLQKVLAQAGLGSRRAAEEMIRQGRVAVNGCIVRELGTRVHPEIDRIRVDDAPVATEPKKVVLLFNKPTKCVTTVRDPQGRKTVMDYIPPMGIRLFPVGRLDYDAEGLLLLTNDGFLAHRLQHPRHGVSKIYEVKVRGIPDSEALKRLRSGVSLPRGTTAPAQVWVLRQTTGSSWLKIVLHQGWYRQIKQMGEAVGHPVLKIRRVAYGPLRLGDLKPATFRFLTSREILQLYGMFATDEERTKAP
ncbi:MAG: rRNA pseudouridine synthase [Syntrophobacteraceae bacterium]|nr:rRNA pseudouridine synthase [Syntrophobacteraceae bacterium]